MKNSTLWSVLNLFIFIWFKISRVEGIVGGRHSKDGQFKYQLALLEDGSSICGAAILDNRRALTAAHCIIDLNQEFKKSEYKVVGGIVDIFPDTQMNRVEVLVETIYVPSVFKAFVYSSENSNQDSLGDIAILKLKEGLGLNKNPYLSELKLPTPFQLGEYENEKPIVSGFGYNFVVDTEDTKTGKIIRSFSRDGDRLKFAHTKVIPYSICKKKYVNPVHESHVCAEVKQHESEHPEGVCIGDSGNPLVLNGNTIIGLLSIGQAACNEKIQPGMYTNVAYYLDFINQSQLGRKNKDIRIATYKSKRIGFTTLRVLTEV